MRINSECEDWVYYSNLLTCILRAWDYSKPFFVALAMNTHEHFDVTAEINYCLFSDFVGLQDFKKVSFFLDG